MSGVSDEAQVSRTFMKVPSICLGMAMQKIACAKKSTQPAEYDTFRVQMITEKCRVDHSNVIEFTYEDN